MNKEIIRAGQLSIKFLVESTDSNGSVAIFEFTVPAGAKVPLPHYHKQFDESKGGLGYVRVPESPLVADSSAAVRLKICIRVCFHKQSIIQKFVIVGVKLVISRSSILSVVSHFCE